ncbi:CIA30 family protein [Marinicella rhabdoformis]|uniref:CIA30 family protein n=1 Tax=Marinicella rhabdoformis TaxID=2580566 RepID=UPI0012AEC791|nr:CIA30 family protein [Marinicella rhabdoformis]
MILQILMVASMVSAKNTDAYSNSYEFKNLNEQYYGVVNDSVMGGRSVSQLRVGQDAAVFNGVVSLKNNGGFASVRMIWPFSDKVSGQFIKLKVLGDGKVYQLRLRTDRGFDGAAYAQSFKTVAGKTQTFTFSVSEFVPTYRGRVLRNMPELNLRNVTQFGIMMTDKQVGDFELSLHKIKIVAEI